MAISITSIRFSELKIPFKQAFKHSSATRSETQTVWAEVRTASGVIGYGEGCPREYVTQESLSSALEFFEINKLYLKNNITDFYQLSQWVKAHRSAIDDNPATWCALELAILDAFAKHEQCSVESLLELPEFAGEFQYSAILGDSDSQTFEKLLTRYYSQGFRDFKVKLSGDLAHDQQKLENITSLNDSGIKVRVDANNLWITTGEAINYIQHLPCAVWAIEEPLVNQDYAQMASISQALDVAIILDESFLRQQQFSHLEENPSQWIINLRISKMGGLIRSLDIAEQATQRNIPLIIGAQVGETSLLTRAALTLSSHFDRNIIAREGGFGTLLLKHDICDPALMINQLGVISVAQIGTQIAGFGIDVNTAQVDMELVGDV